MSRPWMPLYIADYLGDTQHLSTLEHGAYLLLIMQYWQKGGLPDDDTQLMRIARMTQQEWTSAAPVLQRLFEQGWKHERIEGELALADEKIEKKSEAGKKGGRASALARKRAKETKAKVDVDQPSTNASSTGSTDAAAKSNTTTTTTTISNSVPSERTPVASPDPDAELFRRGREVLGKNAGGQIAKLKAAKGGSVALARAAIEQASVKDDPAKYIAAAIKGGAGPPAFAREKPNGAFTDMLLQSQGDQSHDGPTIELEDNDFARH